MGKVLFVILDLSVLFGLLTYLYVWSRREAKRVNLIELDERKQQ